MATPTISTNTYAGKDLEGVIAQSVLRGKTIESGMITVHSDIDSRQVIKTFDSTVTIADSVAAFGSAGSFTLDEKYLDPKAYMNGFEYDYSSLNATWYASQQPRGRGGDFVPPASLEDAIIEQRAALNGKFIDATIWRGSVSAGALSKITVSASSVVTGLEAKFEAGSDVSKLTPTVGSGSLVAATISKAAAAVIAVATTANMSNGDIVSITGAVGTGFIGLNGESYAITVLNGTTFSIPVDSSGFGTYTGSSASVSFINENNILAVLTEVYNDLSEAVEDDPDFYLFMNKKVAKAYTLAQATAANGAGSYFVGSKALDFLGSRMMVLPYISNNVIVAANVSNLHYGTALSGEQNSLAIIPMFENNGDRTVRYRCDYAFDVNYTNGADISFYRPQ